MNPIAPLMNLLFQTERERDERAAACRHTASARDAAVAQTQQLLGYRTEYEQRWAERFRTEGRMELVNCYRGFMTRLDEAVDQQRRSVVRAEAGFELAMAGLREAETRVAAVRRLIERRADEARLAGERLEQKQTDEFAARAAWSRAPSFAASSAGSLA